MSSLFFVALLLALCLATIVWNSVKNPKRAMVGLLALVAMLCVALLAGPALAGEVNYQYQAEVTQSYQVPAPVLAPAPPLVASYVPLATYQFSTLAVLPMQATYLPPRMLEITPTKGQLRRAKRQAARATALVPVPACPVPTLAAPAAIMAPVECEGLEAH